MQSGLLRILGAAACALFLGSAARPEPAGKTYLALGDSLAYGLQVGKLKEQIAAGTVRPGSFDNRLRHGADLVSARESP